MIAPYPARAVPQLPADSLRAPLPRCLRQPSLLQTQSAEHLGVVLRRCAGIEVFMVSFARKPDMTALVARPGVWVGAVGRTAGVTGNHRLEAARAAPWRAERSPLATL